MFGAGGQCDHLRERPLSDACHSARSEPRAPTHLLRRSARAVAPRALSLIVCGQDAQETMTVEPCGVGKRVAADTTPLATDEQLEPGEVAAPGAKRATAFAAQTEHLSTVKAEEPGDSASQVLTLTCGDGCCTIGGFSWEELDAILVYLQEQDKLVERGVSRNGLFARLLFLKVRDTHTAILPCAPNASRFVVAVLATGGAFPSAFFDCKDANGVASRAPPYVPAYLTSSVNGVSFHGSCAHHITPRCLVSTRLIDGELFFQIFFEPRAIEQLKKSKVGADVGDPWTFFVYKPSDPTLHLAKTPPFLLSALSAVKLLQMDHDWSDDRTVNDYLENDYTFEWAHVVKKFGVSELNSDGPCTFRMFNTTFQRNILKTGCMTHFTTHWDYERHIIISNTTPGGVVDAKALYDYKVDKVGPAWLFGHTAGYTVGSSPAFPLNHWLRNPAFELEYWEGKSKYYTHPFIFGRSGEDGLVPNKDTLWAWVSTRFVPGRDAPDSGSAYGKDQDLNPSSESSYESGEEQCIDAPVSSPAHVSSQDPDKEVFFSKPPPPWYGSIHTAASGHPPLGELDGPKPKRRRSADQELVLLGNVQDVGRKTTRSGEY